MSEYWVSKKKYLCKYCNIYIADDQPSKQLHENGLKHKGNLERYIRGIYKAGEKKKKEDEEERREMVRVEQAAQIAYSQDLGAGRAKSGGSTSQPPPIASSSKKPPPKPSNPFANYSTAKSLGYVDPDADAAIAAAQGQRLHGIVGEWQVVEPQAEAAPTSSTEVGVKRSAEELGEEESREFKLRKKTMATGLGQIYDPGALSIKLKKREDPGAEPIAAEPDAPERPKWTKTTWTKAGDEKESDLVKSEEVVREVEEEEKPPSTPDIVKPEPDLEPPLPSETVVFKKRKIPAGGSRIRR
ncbi:hypothetical protein MIND_00053700 [Mycena indigotica]|uniref:Matrin-type domain-containing protein n=1 Tax=Mycena indigotica TaxID=2126181 RepID=A0A8H6TDC5_9AGAR|nr:uncharacterized protein MIND_00053700 [Mycena indigotica]KAF7315390.1 hypothetical protein MIND_00053700 [Mycena indigotica]